MQWIIVLVALSLIGLEAIVCRHFRYPGPEARMRAASAKDLGYRHRY